MNDSLEYIEAYFEKQLDEPSMRLFERQCEQDAAFASDVALYITTREAMRQALVEQKREQWRPLSERQFKLGQAEPALVSLPEANLVPAASTSTPVRKLIIRRWLPIAAAASLLLFVVTYFSNSGPGLGTQVTNYTAEELQPTSNTMSIADTFELAKSAYKNKKYDSAHLFCNYILQADSQQDQVLLLNGRTFLAQKQYDSALHYFEKLLDMDLASNSGPFDAALTLLNRNQKGDREKAQVYLQRIVDDKDGHLEGKEKAQKLLDRMK